MRHGGSLGDGARLASLPSVRPTDVGRRCDRQTSATAGSLFADTHLPLRVWFEALWHVTSQKGGTSALGLQRVLGLGATAQRGHCCTNCVGRWFVPVVSGCKAWSKSTRFSSAARNRASVGAERKARYWWWSQPNRRPRGSVASGWRACPTLQPRAWRRRSPPRLSLAAKCARTTGGVTTDSTGWAIAAKSPAPARTWAKTCCRWPTASRRC